MPTKILQKEISQTEKTLRAKYEIPEKLGFLITVANRFPSESDLPDVLEFFKSAKKKLSEEEAANFTQEKEWKLVVSEIIEVLGTSERSGSLILGVLMQAFASVGKLPESSAVDAILLPDVVKAFIGIYANIKNDRDNFVKFAQALDDIRKGKREKSDLERFTTVIIPYISDSNKIEMQSNTFFLEGVKGIDADRLRICEICNEIFWAKRKDSETCSKSCFNALRQRRHRERNKDEINAKRRENYKYKKEKKKGNL